MTYRSGNRLAGLLALLLISFSALAQIPQRPQPQRLVNDLAGIFSQSQKMTLEKMVDDFSNATSNQIAVVAVPQLYGYSKAELAYSIGEAWGIGQKEFDNGIVILIKPKTADSRGEVFIATGYGLEAAVTDAFARRVIEGEMIPYFRQNDYYSAVCAALEIIMPVAAGEISSDAYGVKSAGEGGSAVPFLFLLFILLFAIAMARNSKGNNRNMGGDNHRGGGRDFTLADAILLGSIFSNSGRSHGSFGGGSSFGGGFGGGFGGFGGGSFGGGGAGGSW